MNRFSKDNEQQSEAGPGRSERSRPLREFSHNPHKAEPSRQSHRLSAVAHWLVPLMVFCIILAAGVFVALYYYGQDEAGVDDAGQAALSSFSNRMEPSELLDAYLNAMGGRDALERVRSVRYEGRVIFESAEKDFQMLLSLPDKGMLVTNPGGPDSLKLMLNGDTAWQVIEKRDGSREVMPLKKGETKALKWSMRVHNTFHDLALRGRFSGLSVKETEFEDQPCYEVTKTMPNGAAFTAILDKESLYLVKTVEKVSAKDGSDTFTVLYDDHRIVSGVVEPYSTTLYRNGKLDNKVVIESIRINPGVISALFEIPEEIEK